MRKFLQLTWCGLRNLTASVLARWKIWWKTSSPERIDWECWWKISSHSLFIRFSNPGIEYYTASSSSMSEKYPWLRRGSNKDILHVSNVFVVAAPPHPPHPSPNPPCSEEWKHGYFRDKNKTGREYLLSNVDTDE